MSVNVDSDQDVIMKKAMTLSVGPSYNRYSQGFTEMSRVRMESDESASSVALFVLPPEFVKDFSRTKNNPIDCVINALQLLGIVDMSCSHLLRVVIKEQLNNNQIDEIFEWVYQGSGYAFKMTDMTSTTNNDSFKQFATNSLPMGHAAIFGVQWKSPGQGGHVFVIAKGTDNQVYLIDPHITTKDPVTGKPVVETVNLTLNPSRWSLIHNNLRRWVLRMTKR